MATIYIENKKVSVKENITRKALHVANRVMKTPFQIAIKDHNDILNCEEIIRIVPEKRILAFGKWGNQNVAIKLFYQKRHAKRHAERDAFGIESLMQANVPTARLLYKGNIDKGRVYILIFEKINHGVSLDTLWKNHENFEDMRELLHAVTIELATQHVLGILQRDLHLNNLLITPKHIYTLDGGMIDYFERPLDHKLSLEYLALFLVQLGVAFGSLQQELFKHYTKSRGWIVKPAEIKVFNKFISKLTEERMHNYKKKIFRKCTSFNKLDKFNKNLIYDRQYESPEFKALLANPDARIDNPAAIVLKAGRSSTVVKVIVDGRELVVKRYNRKNVWHGMRRCLRETRAKKSWRISQQLFASGVATPKPVACIENKFLCLRGKSYFITEYLNGQDLGSYLNEHQSDTKACERMAKNTLALFKSMTKLRIIQGDLKMTNILVRNHKPYLIDFDGAQEYFSQLALRRAFKNEITRFMQNWQNLPTIHALFDRLKNDEILT